MKAQVAFHYGWTNSEIERLPYKTFLEYWICITVIEANKMMNDIQVAAYPHHNKQSERKKVINRLKRIYKKYIKSEPKVIDKKSIVAALLRRDDG